MDPSLIQTMMGLVILCILTSHVSGGRHGLHGQLFPSVSSLTVWIHSQYHLDMSWSRRHMSGPPSIQTRCTGALAEFSKMEATFQLSFLKMTEVYHLLDKDVFLMGLIILWISSQIGQFVLKVCSTQCFLIKAS